MFIELFWLILNRLFIYACSHNKFPLALWLYHYAGINININNLIHPSRQIHNNPFLRSCENGHLTISKWLYHLSSHSITAYTYGAQLNEPFTFACTNGQLHIAQWLHTLDTNHEFSLFQTLEICCSYYQYSTTKPIIEWLLTLNILTIPELTNAFFTASRQGDLYHAKLLNSLAPTINIHSHNDIFFHNAIYSYKTDLILWMFSTHTFPETLINKYSTQIGHNNQIVALLYNQKYKATSPYLKEYYHQHIKRRITYYKLLISLTGRLIKIYEKTCQHHYRYGGTGYTAAHTNFKLSVQLFHKSSIPANNQNNEADQPNQ